METSDLVDRLLRGERRALARLLTYLEDGADERTGTAAGLARVREIVAALHPHTGRAHLVGITGSPGVGKSTLTNALVGELRSRELTVGVVAVDPSSPFSGGALLGDRIRMADHALDEGVFIRSMASRGHLGGLSWATPQALLAMDAAGFDWVIVETVGVGQAEVEIAQVADTTLVAVAPGMGDAIQAAKAGILEVADVFVVNKADRDGAHRTVRELRGMLELGHGEWLPPICSTVASEGRGITELVDAIDEHRRWALDSGARQAARRRAARLQVREIVLRAVRSRMAAIDEGALLDELVAEVADLRTDPYTAADRLLARVEI